MIKIIESSNDEFVDDNKFIDDLPWFSRVYWNSGETIDMHPQFDYGRNSSENGDLITSKKYLIYGESIRIEIHELDKKSERYAIDALTETGTTYKWFDEKYRIEIKGAENALVIGKEIVDKLNNKSVKDVYDIIRQYKFKEINRESYVSDT